MLLTLQAEQAAEATQNLTQNLRLPDGPLMLYRALHTCSLEAAEVRDYCPGVTHVTIHCPAEIVAEQLGVSRMSVWRWSKVLQAEGLLDARAHKGTLRGETRATGVLWQVRLNPARGTRARLGFADLRHQWRDLDQDVKRKRTAYRMVQEARAEGAVTVSKDPTKPDNYSLMLSWVLAPQLIKSPLSLTVTGQQESPHRHDLEQLLDLPGVPRDERNRAVQLAAEALAMTLRDQGSVRFWQRLLWQLLRVSDQASGDHFYSLYLAACRARADVAEGFGQRPGALLVSRLKGAPWFDEVMRAPATRVGTVPS
jgi:hypothetical protein